MARYLVIHNTTELIRVLPENIVYIKAEGNFCRMYLSDNKECLVSFQLGEVTRLINELELPGVTKQFLVRIGKSYIINTNYIYKINISSTESKRKFVLSDNRTFSHELDMPLDSIKQIKKAIEEGYM